MMHLSAKLTLGLFLAVNIFTAQMAKSEETVVQKKQSSYRVIPETIPSKKNMTLVLLSNDLINDLRFHLDLYAKSDEATQSEILNTISALLYLEAIPQDEQSSSYCDIAVQEYLKLRQETDKELDPEIANRICAIVLESTDIAKELTKPYYMDSGNSDNMNRKIARMLRSNLLMVIDYVLKSVPSPNNPPKAE